MSMLVTRLMEEATNSYEKILTISKEIENNLQALGLDFSFKFIIEQRCIIFEFSRHGLTIYGKSYAYSFYKELDSNIIIEELMEGAIKELTHWRVIINALQQ